MATNPNIALSYRPNVALQRRDPLADAANIQALQANQTKMDDLREFKQLSTRLAAAGRDPDPLALVREMRASGRPDMVEKSFELETRVKALGLEDQAYKELIGGGAAAPAMPQAAPAGASMFDVPAGAQPSGDYTSTQAMGRVPGVVTTPIPESPPMNALAPAPAAPTNAMAPAIDPQAQEITRLMGIATRFPTTKAGMQAMKNAELLQQTNKPYVVGGRLVTGAGTELYAAPDKPTELQRNYEFAKTPAGGNFKGSFADFKVLSTPKTTVQLPPQEKAFESGLGAGQSKRILDNQVAAQDAAEILRTNQVGRDLLKAGAITGTGADFLVGLNNALKQVGVDFGYADAAANSQAYVATLGANVGRIIKQFGAGTGLSDADRDFAEKIAGGKIALTETALRRILDINDKASNRVIDLHNKNVAGIKTNIPLTVEKPVFQRPPASAANQIPGNAPAPAQAAPAARTVVRTGTLNGRRVIQYSDGSTEYGN